MQLWPLLLELAQSFVCVVVSASLFQVTLLPACPWDAGCPFFVLCALWWVCYLLSVLWDALHWLTSLFSLQLFPSVSCRRDTPPTCLVRGHLPLHTLTVPHTSPLSSCHSHNIFVLSSEQPFLPRYHVSTLRMIWVILRFVGCLFGLFWQSFVFLMPKCSDRNMNMPKIWAPLDLELIMVVRGRTTREPCVPGTAPLCLCAHHFQSHHYYSFGEIFVLLVHY